ncbi:MAG: GDP-6-deoxy-D-mannose reductase [Bacteroidetes bacterium ADurb.Bin217]|nr:MAG: GDP-6-deoxy-D-mannose reductase [Bacteroidetes bacterium ADurb.Bin217]
MKIIVTGATGSLGASITKYFAKEGHQVIATGRTKNPPKQLLEIAEYIQADITQPFELPEADLIIHTAALSDDKAKLKDLLVANVEGTIHTVNAAVKCKKFIHISSSSVYLPSPIPLQEEIAGKQNNKQLSPYGLSKLKSEIALIEKNTIDSCFILRSRAHYGPCDKMILPRILKLEKNGVIHHPGSMQINISMTHYKNVIQAIECCIKSDKKGVNIYNVADEQTYVFIEAIRKICSSIYGKKLPEKQIPIFVLKCMSWFKINGITPLLVRSFSQDMTLDISKIKMELGYSAVTSLEQSLPELKQWIESIGGINVLKTGAPHLAWE